METLEKLVKCWHDSIAGNRHWGLQAAKQSDPQIMLCMETMKMSKADMSKGFFHIVQPLGFDSYCLGLSCHAAINANVCAPLCQHGRAMKRSICVEIHVIFARSVTAFWKLLPSNRSGINHYLYVFILPPPLCWIHLLAHFKGKGISDTMHRSRSYSVAHNISVTMKLLVITHGLFHLCRSFPNINNRETFMSA